MGYEIEMDAMRQENRSYEEGYKDRMAGKARVDNPHKNTDSPEHKAWMDGFDSASREFDLP